jgi:hypothetical protein
MALKFPEYYIPIIGFAQHQLGMGDSPEVTVEKLLADKRYGYLSPTEIQEVMALAQANQTAQQRLDRFGPDASIFSAFGAGASALSKVGIRVKIPVKVGDAKPRDTTVLVNVDNQATLEDVFAFALYLLTTPGSSIYQVGDSRVGTPGQPEVISVVAEGFNTGISIGNFAP